MYSFQFMLTISAEVKLDYLAFSYELPLTPRKIKVADCYMHRGSNPRVKTGQFKVV